MATLDPRGKEVRIVLLGKTGTGKSSVGNTLLGKKLLKCKASASSVTTKCATASVPLSDEKTLLIVDTPGLYDTDRSFEDTCKEIARAVTLLTPGVHVFIIVIAIGRFTNEEMKTITTLQALFGEQISEYVLVVFTGKASLDVEDQTIEDFLKDAPDNLRSMLSQCGGRYVAIDNLAKGEELEGYMNDVRKLILTTIEIHEGGFYTNAVFAAAEAEVQERMKANKQVNEVRQEILYIDDAGMEQIMKVTEIRKVAEQKSCLIM